MRAYAVVAYPAVYGGFNGDLKVEVSFLYEFCNKATEGLKIII